MARGSSGGSSGGAGSTAVEMQGRAGSIENTGKYVIRKKFYTDNEADLTQAPTAPTGFRATAISWQKIGAGAYEQTVDYEYQVAPQTSNLIETTQGVTGRFELDVQDELFPIAAHPEIRELIKKYKGTVDTATGKVTFPPTYTPQAGGGLNGAGGGGVRTNPMAGKLYFTKPAATFRHIQQTDQIPSNIWSNVGKKVAQLPAGFPNPPDFINRNGETIKYFWVVLSPQIYRRGNAYEIVRSYKLSEPGAPDELYPLDTPATNAR